MKTLTQVILVVFFIALFLFVTKGFSAPTPKPTPSLKGTPRPAHPVIPKKKGQAPHLMKATDMWQSKGCPARNAQRAKHGKPMLDCSK